MNSSKNLIDFDYCKREVRTFDISNFMIKVLKRVDWNIEFAKAILDSYNEVLPLIESEYKVLYAYLQFPQRYWRLANRYYYNEVNWGQNTFGSKIESIIITCTIICRNFFICTPNLCFLIIRN